MSFRFHSSSQRKHSGAYLTANAHTSLSGLRRSPASSLFTRQMALHNSGGIADLPVAVTDLTNSLNSIAAMSGMKYCHIPPHGTPYDGGGGSGGGPGVSQLISYPATVNGVMSFPGPRGPLQSAAVFGQMQTASGPPTAAAAASPASGNVGTDLASFNTAVVGGPNGPGNAAPPNGLESPHSSVAGATTMVLSQPPSEPVSRLMWEWAHWLTGRRTRLHVPQHDLALIMHTPGFTYSGDMEEPSPSDSQSTGQPLGTQHIHWADGVVWCKRQIGNLSSHGFKETVILSGTL
ncbi:unnamed protein product [Schistocephalus solidus]|uniref:Runx1 n=1 Tax=Schistocephalus solidus TaxID=70667 RepID=A0A183SJB0_SCHSO|nr:unnamed protein product [Schistocephalus solidus]